jgi:hypothetical protein
MLVEIKVEAVRRRLDMEITRACSARLARKTLPGQSPLRLTEPGMELLFTEVTFEVI